jgi:hypothetical protein
MDNLSITDLSSLTPEQRASLTRHGAAIERASNLLGNDATKLSTFRSHISTFNRGSMTPEQLIDAFFALFNETSSNALGTLVREVADLFEDKKKGEALRRAWQNWRAINEDYPSLPGLGGMHGATTSTSGWAAAVSANPPGVAASSQQQAAAAAQQLRHSNRVLKLKNSTLRRSSLGGGQPSVMSEAAGRSSPAAYNPSFARGAGSVPASSSSIAFPALPGGGSSSVAPRSSSTTQPSWVGASTGSSVGGRGASASASTASSAKKPGQRGGLSASSEDAFPALPAAPKPQTTIFGYGRGAVRRDLGGPRRDTGFAWGGGGGASSSSGDAAAGGDSAGGEEQTGDKAGKKKNKKQVLVHWG